MSWVVWEYIVLRRFGLDVPLVRLLASPRAVWIASRLISRFGTVAFGEGHAPVNGAFLRTLWAVEALTVLAVATVLPYRMLRLLAFCDACGRWCHYRQGLLSISYGSGDQGDEHELRTRLEQKDFAVLEEYGKADMDSSRRFRIDLQHCLACGQTHLMSVFLIRVRFDENGRRREKARRVVDRLWIDPAQAEQVTEIKDRLWPPIAAVAEAPVQDEAPSGVSG